MAELQSTSYSGLRGRLWHPTKTQLWTLGRWCHLLSTFSTHYKYLQTLGSTKPPLGDCAISTLKPWVQTEGSPQLLEGHLFFQLQIMGDRDALPCLRWRTEKTRRCSVQSPEPSTPVRPEHSVTLLVAVFHDPCQGVSLETSAKAARAPHGNRC